MQLRTNRPGVWGRVLHGNGNGKHPADYRGFTTGKPAVTESQISKNPAVTGSNVAVLGNGIKISQNPQARKDFPNVTPVRSLALYGVALLSRYNLVEFAQRPCLAYESWHSMIQLGQIPVQCVVFTEMCWCALCPSRLPVAWYVFCGAILISKFWMIFLLGWASW